jgi:hypothetical protein
MFNQSFTNKQYVGLLKYLNSFQHIIKLIPNSNEINKIDNKPLVSLNYLSKPIQKIAI